jgi:hypothetical protein
MAKRKMRKSMVQSLGGLTHVTSLRLMLLGKDESSKLLYEGLRDAWRVVAPRLTELRLTICFELVPTLVELDARALGSLERLTLVIQPRRRSDWSSFGHSVLIGREAAPALALWITAIGSISYLNMHFPNEEWFMFVFNDFLSSFPAGNLPRLATLQVCLPAPSDATISSLGSSSILSTLRLSPPQGGPRCGS